jgi:hypothetical protein
MSKQGLDKNPEFAISAYHTGDFMKRDPRDTDYAIKRELIEAGKKVNPQAGGAITPFGLVMADREDINYLKSKKEQEANLRMAQFGEYLINEKDPSTQAHAYAILPQLKTKPEQWYSGWIAEQIALYHILLDGRINSEEDLAFIYKITRADYVIPTTCAWDPHGVLKAKDDDDPAVGKMFGRNQKGISHGLFSMRQWGLEGLTAEAQTNLYDNYGQMAGATEEQFRIKCKILKRLMPGLKDKKTKEIKEIIMMNSPVTGEPADQSVWSNYMSRYLPDPASPAYTSFGPAPTYDGGRMRRSLDPGNAYAGGYDRDAAGQD